MAAPTTATKHPPAPPTMYSVIECTAACFKRRKISAKIVNVNIKLWAERERAAAVKGNNFFGFW